MVSPINRVPPAVGTKQRNVIDKTVMLSIDRINLRAPYVVACRDNGDFIFETDKSQIYSVGFMPDNEIAGCASYQFFINRLRGEADGSDEKIRMTIMVIIDEFFATHNDIMLYICDTSDGREAARNRLFLRWFKQADTTNRFTILTADAKVENETIYAALIVQNSHPKLSDIKTEFELLSTNLTDK